MSKDKKENEKVKEIPVKDPKDWEQECEELREKCRDTEEKYLRLAADFENYKKRQRKFMDDMINSMRDSILGSFLDIKDDFERALDAAEKQKDYDSLHQGVEMIYKHLNDFLCKEGVVEMECKGKPFDPCYHEAVSVLECDPENENDVIEVVRKGYQCQDRLVRPARVVVGKAKEEQKNENSEGE
ncbi:nucleotide exchange factor GrpE [bacterium]|nr:nucleotide exchange factor GrpE [bacterium]